jgi:hypothetical protein
MRTIDGYDVVVAGGGPGGFAAAVAAARGGAKTILLEREGCLGGGMTTMMVCPFMPHTTSEGPGGEGRKVVNAGVFWELCDRLLARGAAEDGVAVSFDDEAAKGVLDELTRGAGVEVIFHAALYDAETADGRVQAATFAHNGGPVRVPGKVFVDGTGDAVLAARAGAEVRFGTDSGRVMPMTTKFVVGGVDLARAPDRNTLRERCKRGAEDDPPLVNLNLSTFRAKADKGWAHFNAIRVSGLSTIDPFDLSAAEAEGRKRVENFVAWLRANVPGYEKAYLVKTGSHIGIRESRRVMGDYVLSYDDWKSCRRFDDAVACCSYGIDIHGDKQNETNLQSLPPGGYYQIPYRCLTPVGLENLLVAGRSISADVEAHSSLRIMPTVMCIGQAAGAAAAMALPAGDVRGVDVAALQQAIRQAGGVLEPA